MDDNKKLFNKIKWAQDYIAAYNKKYDFDPLKVLSGQENRKDKLYIVCCNFLGGIDEALYEFEKAQKAAL